VEQTRLIWSAEGIVLGNADFIHRRSLLRFHEALAWLMQIMMLLVLGLLVFPSRLPQVAGVSLLLSLFLVLVARPVAVLLSLAFAKLRFRQKLLIARVGLRGAVPIVLATFPFLAGLPRAELYFDVVFFIVLTSVLLQGTSIPLVARWLRLNVPLRARQQHPLEFFPTTNARDDLVELNVPGSSPVADRRIMDLPLPKSALIVLVGRGGDFVAPDGSTVLETGDALLVLADKDDVPALRALVEPPS
jgi:cell volume regulation protein A